MSPLDLRRCVTLSLVATLVACGGSTVDSSGSDGGGTPDGGSRSDARGSNDATPKRDTGASPDSGHAPHPDGSTGRGDASDATGPDGAATPDATTHDSGTPDASAPPDAGVDAPIGAGCSATIPSGMCTQVGQMCEYPTAACICSHGSVPTTMLSWYCTTLPAGCPDPAPALDSSCSSPGTVCDYGMCMGGEKVVCTGGKWVTDQGGCPG
jgi:hypothetical protein